MTANDSSQDSQRILVWDLPLRLFHWLLVVCVIGSWLTAESGVEWAETHFILGYITLGLLSFRLLWGFVGPKHARFGSFLTGPRAVGKYLLALGQKQRAVSVGHSPLGGWASIILLLCITVQAFTGLFISDDIIYAGPYNPLVSADTAATLAWLHHLNFDLLCVLLVFHIAAIACYRLLLKESLLTPMLTGFKTVEQQYSANAVHDQRRLVALILGFIVAALVTLLVYLAPEPSSLYF